MGFQLFYASMLVELEIWVQFDCFCRSSALLAVSGTQPLRHLRAAAAVALPGLEVCVPTDVGGSCLCASVDLALR